MSALKCESAGVHLVDEIRSSQQCTQCRGSGLTKDPRSSTEVRRSCHPEVELARRHLFKGSVSYNVSS